MMVDDHRENYLCMPTRGLGPGGARPELQSAVHSLEYLHVKVRTEILKKILNIQQISKPF